MPVLYERLMSRAENHSKGMGSTTEKVKNGDSSIAGMAGTSEVVKKGAFIMVTLSKCREN